MLTEGTYPLLSYDDPDIRVMAEAMNAEWVLKEPNSAGWRRPDDYHVTTFFVGGRPDNFKNELCTNFVPSVQVPVRILALVVIPNRIIAGVCFPDHPIGNKCPHVTLMIKDCKPFISNVLLEGTCLDDGPFTQAYKALKSDGRVKAGDELLKGTLQFDKGGPPSTVYFVFLENPVEFGGVTKIYF